MIGWLNRLGHWNWRLHWRVLLIITVALFAVPAIALAQGARKVNEGQPPGMKLDGSISKLVIQPGLAPFVYYPGREQMFEQIYSLAAADGGKYGVDVVELDTGASFGINQDDMFQAASTVKVAILADLYQQIEEGDITRDDVLTYTEADYEEGTGSIQYSDFGTQWTISQLTYTMMKESDNVAANMIIRTLGLGQIQSFINRQGSVFDLESDQTTPASMANILTHIARGQTVSAQNTDEIFQLMTGTYNEDMLPRYLSGVNVAHKNGAWGNSVADVGVVFLPGRPYVICVFSDDDPDTIQAEATIAAISLSVYEYESARLPLPPEPVQPEPVQP